MSRKFTVEIRCENAAFGDSREDASEELKVILSELITAIHGGKREYAINDINGNSVGCAYFTGKWDKDDVFDDPEVYTIAKHFVSYLANGDDSGYSSTESRRIKEWEQNVMDGRVGHFKFADEEEEDNFELCDVCGQLNDCTTVTFWPNKRR